MALTRVTSSVLDSNAISAEKIANSALTNRMYGVKSIGLENLQNDANFLVYIGNFNANTNLVENNVRQTSANAAVERANVLTITSNIVQNVANINLNTGTGVRLSQNLAANVNQTTANVTAVEARRVANIAGAVSTITTGNLTASRALVSDGSGKVAVSDVTSTELGYVDGVTSAIQTQLDAGVTNAAAVVTEALGIEARRVANIAGAVSSITTSDLTASRALVSDGSGKVAVLASVTSTELGYVDATSSIQTQLDAGVTNAAAVVTEAVGIEARRVANIAGAVSTITTSDLTASRAVVSSGAGKVSVSDVTSTELGYLDGVTSAIQTQLDSKGSSAGYEANDFVTYTRLNANINVVSSNVAVGQIMKVNVIASTDGEGAGNNNFFIATPPAGNPAVIDNIAVTIDGVTQAKTTDYLYTAGTGKITFKDAAIPTGLTVTITSLNPPA